MILIAEQTWSVFMCCLSSFLEGSLNCFQMFVVAGGGREKNRSYLNYRLILCSYSASINQTSFPTYDLQNYQDTWSVFNCLSFFLEMPIQLFTLFVATGDGRVKQISPKLPPVYYLVPSCYFNQTLFSAMIFIIKNVLLLSLYLFLLKRFKDFIICFLSQW